MLVEDGIPRTNDAGASDLELAESALDGDPQAAAKVLAMLRSPALGAFLRSRGATETEASDIIGNLCGDCFGGERAKGGMHRLLGRYNGACPLPAFLRRVAVNRLISLKRKQARWHEPAGGAGEPGEAGARRVIAGAEPGEPGAPGADEEIIPLLRDALQRAFAAVDAEKLVLFRLIHSHGVPQKRVAGMWGWHESKVSRAMEALRGELKDAILAEVRRRDAWLELQWDDFIGLCAESNDLFPRVPVFRRI
jgi:DNA-directed RNA polymerase specialized sigma24 family protein